MWAGGPSAGCTWKGGGGGGGAPKRERRGTGLKGCGAGSRVSGNTDPVIPGCTDPAAAARWHPARRMDRWRSSRLMPDTHLWPPARGPWLPLVRKAPSAAAGASDRIQRKTVRVMFAAPAKLRWRKAALVHRGRGMIWETHRPQEQGRQERGRAMLGRAAGKLARDHVLRGKMVSYDGQQHELRRWDARRCSPSGSGAGAADCSKPGRLFRFPLRAWSILRCEVASQRAALGRCFDDCRAGQFI